MKKLLLLLSFPMILLAGCDKSDTFSGGGGDDDSSPYEGVWVRQPGASGDRTDLAIGNISGEPDNRVYMCEKRGSTAAGFYKGTIDGSTITFDSKYNLPTYSVWMEDGELMLKGDVSYSIATPYRSGSWSGECGPLQAGGYTGGGSGGGTGAKTGSVMFWTATDHSCGPISVTINGQSGTVSSYYSSGTPSCGASGCANFTLPVGTYSYTASCSGYSWGNSSITVTEGGCFKMKLN